MIILVSGSTAIVRRLAECGRGNLGALLTPSSGNSVRATVAMGLPWALDNGAYSSFDPGAFRQKLARVAGQPRFLWACCPDVVGDASATLARFGSWRDELQAAGIPIAFVGQDGIERLSIPWSDFTCWFIGGSTRWKLSAASARLAAEARARGKWVHMGRVNSLRRLSIAYAFGCDSIDGSGYSRFAQRARLKGRNDMLLERHLRFIRGLEREHREQSFLFPALTGRPPP